MLSSKTGLRKIVPLLLKIPKSLIKTVKGFMREMASSK
jgi:hypothetical protein